MRFGKGLFAATAASLITLAAPPVSAGVFEALQRGWQDLKASFKQAPEQIKDDGENAWKNAEKDASKAADRGRDAAGDAVKDAKKGWQEVKDAVK